VKRARLWRLLALVPGVLLSPALAFAAVVWTMDIARGVWPPYTPEADLLGWDRQGRLLFAHQEKWAPTYDTRDFTCGGSGLYALRADDGAEALVTGEEWCGRAAASRFHPQLTLGASGLTLFSPGRTGGDCAELRVLDVAQKRWRQPLRDCSSLMEETAVTPDGRSLVASFRCYYATTAGSRTLETVPKGCAGDDRLRLRPLFSGPGRLIGIPGDGHPRWSPDGRSLLVQNEDHYAVIDTVTGIRRDIIRSGENAAWSPDGHSIAFTRFTSSSRSGRRATLHTIRVDGTSERTRFSRKERRPPPHRAPPLDGIPGDPLWTPDGRSIVFLRWTGRRYEIWCVNRDGSGLRHLTDAIRPRNPLRRLAPGW